jgi:hypothetical protein
MDLSNLDIIIENPKGSYKPFEVEDESYPLKGVTYPVDYGYIKDYWGEDGAELDVFVGSGDLCGVIKVWRLDVLEETKVFINVTQVEFDQILGAFKPVLLSSAVMSKANFIDRLSFFKEIPQN